MKVAPHLEICPAFEISPRIIALANREGTTCRVMKLDMEIVEAPVAGAEDLEPLAILGTEVDHTMAMGVKL